MTRISIISRLLSLIAAASGLAFTSTEAAVLYTDNADITISSGSDSIYFDLDHDSAGPAYASTMNFAGHDVQLFFRVGIVGKPSLGGGVNGVSSGDYISRLSAGTLISSASPMSYALQLDGVITPLFSPDASTPASQWDGSAEGYLGLWWYVPGGIKYGWARVAWDDTGKALTLKDFAVETDLGVGILAGDIGVVPEPSRALMLATGLAGTMMRRRRKTVI